MSTKRQLAAQVPSEPPACFKTPSTPVTLGPKTSSVSFLFRRGQHQPLLDAVRMDSIAVVENEICLAEALGSSLSLADLAHWAAAARCESSSPTGVWKNRTASCRVERRSQNSQDSIRQVGTYLLHFLREVSAAAFTVFQVMRCEHGRPYMSDYRARICEGTLLY